MTAEPIEPEMRPWSPDPVRQRVADYTIEDVVTLPDDSPRVELVDGVMLVVPAPTFGHQTIQNLLWARLHELCPDHLTASTGLGVAVTPNSTCEPDVLVHSAETGRSRHYLMPHEVVLVVEVVSPSTRRRDRLEKPVIYAEAGIPHFWRVEQEPEHVFAYRLKNGIYQEQANSADELVVDEPFPIRLPLREITP